MSIIILSILAAASPGIRAVEPIKSPASWMTNDDYPAKLGFVNTPVKLALAIDARGKASRCDIIDSSGLPELDRYTCALIMARSTFKPAHDSEGNAVAGMFTSRVRYRSEADFMSEASEPDIVFTVSKLPNIKRRPLPEAWLVMSASAVPEACKLADYIKERALEGVICPVLMRMSDLPPVFGADGNRVRGVRSITIGFTLNKQ